MQNFVFLIVILINFLSVGIETDIYVPALPQMLLAFNTQEVYLQQLLSINFVGLLIGGLIFGPLSDRYSSKSLLLLGQSIFFFASIGCAIANTIPTMTILRFIQGIGAAAPITLSTAIIFSRYNEKQASIFMGHLNGSFTIGMAIAPIIGNYLAIHFGWRSCFIAISGLSLAALLASISTLPKNTYVAEKVSYRELLTNFVNITCNKKFIRNTLIFSLMLACLTVYISNLSLIFVNSFAIPQEQFGYYQAVAIIPCIIFGFVSSYLIDKCGITFTRRLALSSLIIGGLALGLTAVFFPKSAILISLSMMIVTMGNSLGIGMFFSQALSQFPNARGVASSIATSIRLILTASFISLSGFIFNNTIIPVSLLIISMICLILFFYWLDTNENKNSIMQTIT